VIALQHERHQYALRRWRMQADAAIAVAELHYLAATAEESSHDEP
jgi:hypothetical protein